MASCVSRRVNLLQEPDKHIPHYEDTVSYEDYHIRRNDRLDVRVYSVDENVQKLFNTVGLSNRNLGYNTVSTNAGYSNELYTYLVLEDGTIKFPLIGNLEVAGLSTREVKIKLEEELSSYIRSYGEQYKMISIDVRVVQRMFSIITDGKSGHYSMRREKMTVFEALAMAGNLGDWSEHSKVQIIRQMEDGQTKVIMFDVRSKDIINSEYYYIEPNDVIYVRQHWSKPFGVTDVLTGVGIVTTTVSFGLFIYSIVQRSIKAAKSTK